MCLENADFQLVKAAGHSLIVLLTIVLVLLTAAPANAAALGSPTWSVNNTQTSAAPVEYEWDFQTATTSNLNRLTMSMPAGTRTTATPYFRTPGAYLERAYTPDRPANQITGDLDIRVNASLDDWTLGGYQTLLSQWYPGQRSYLFAVTDTGYLQVGMSTDGSNYTFDSSTLALPASNGQAIWARVAVDRDNGAGQRETRFYTSSDGTTWNQLGSTVTGSVMAALHNSTSEITIGANWAGEQELAAGNFYAASVRDGIDGTEKVQFNPAMVVSGASSWTGALGETWTVNRTSAVGADVLGNLTAPSGLPLGGSAAFHYTVGAAVYRFSTTSVPSGTAAEIRLGGFVNSPNPGSYSSNIATFNNLSSVDSGTTNSLTLVAGTSTSTVTLDVLPALTFTTAAHVGSCNGVAQTAGSSSSGTAVGLGRINSANGVAAQDLTVATNAAYGYSVQMLRVQPMGLADVSGTNAAPVAFPALGTEAFGYTTSDATLGSGTANRFTSGGAKWAALTTGNAEVAAHPSAIASDTVCVGFQAGTAPTTSAGVRSTTVVYTALASY